MRRGSEGVLQSRRHSDVQRLQSRERGPIAEHEPDGERRAVVSGDGHRLLHPVSRERDHHVGHVVVLAIWIHADPDDERLLRMRAIRTGEQPSLRPHLDSSQHGR